MRMQIRRKNMKIFGIKFFEKNETSKKIEIINSIILKIYSQKEIISIFYKLFEKYKTDSIFEYELNSIKNFSYNHLHLELIKFFNFFDFFKINDFYLSKNYVKNFIWGENYIAKEDLYTKYNYDYIQIGIYNGGSLCVRHNGLNIYEDSIIGVDDDIQEKFNNVEDDNIFLNLFFEILFSKYQDSNLDTFKTHIINVLNDS